MFDTQIYAINNVEILFLITHHAAKRKVASSLV